MRKRRLQIAMVILTAVMSIPASAPSISAGTQQVNPRLVRQVRHELATLPYYGVFDWLEFEAKPDNTGVARVRDASYDEIGRRGPRQRD